MPKRKPIEPMPSLPEPSNTTASAPTPIHTNPPQNNAYDNPQPKPNHKPHHKYKHKHKHKHKNKHKNKNRNKNKNKNKNTTPPNKQNKTTSKTFHQFPFLPTEIRLQIWSKIQEQQQNNNKEPHVLHINYDTKKRRGQSQNDPNSNHGEWRMNHIQSPPVSLSICQESRSSSLPYFKENYGIIRLLTREKDDATTQAQASWFDFSRDIVFLDTNGQIYEERSRRRQPPRGCPINLFRVRHFAIAEDFFYWPFNQAWAMIDSQWEFFTSIFNAFKVVEDVKVVRDGWQTDLNRDLQIRFKDVGQDWDIEDGGGAEYNIGERWMRWWVRILCKELVVTKVEIEDRKHDKWIEAKNLRVLQLLPFASNRL